MAFMYRKTVDGSPLRRLFVAIITCVPARSEVSRRSTLNILGMSSVLDGCEQGFVPDYSGQNKAPNFRHIADP